MTCCRRESKWEGLVAVATWKGSDSVPCWILSDLKAERERERERISHCI